MPNQDQIPVIEFKRLLYALKDARPDIGLRVRLMGELWKPYHLRVFQLTEKGVALYEDLTRKLTMIPDLAHIMQFELDQGFQQYQPHFHYSVDTAYVNY